MIFINELMAEYLKREDYLIVFKRCRRHLTGNREKIMIIRNLKHVTLGKCIVTPIREDIRTINENDLFKLLKAYLDFSGYNSVDDWIKDIKETNSKEGGIGYLYQINKVFMNDDN